MRTDPEIEALLGPATRPAKADPGTPETDRPAKRGRGRPVVDNRQRLTLAQAKLAEIRARKLSGELVAAADVATEWASILIDTRNRLLAVPSRVRSARPHLADADVAAFDVAIREALQALASGEGAEA